MALPGAMRKKALGRKLRPRRMLRLRRRGFIRRRVLNPTPTFVETYSKSTVASNAGGVFSARISDIPQLAQYSNLYKQYRINWIKVMLVPDFNSMSADHNAAAYNASIPIQDFGLARIAYAINDTPALNAPANEAQLLEDNGCKIKPLGAKFSVSFKPVPDVSVVSNSTGGNIATRQRYRQWFNFDTVTTGNNPLHYGVSYWITQLVANTQANPTYNVYYKVNFSLRDPQ